MNRRVLKLITAFVVLIAALSYSFCAAFRQNSRFETDTGYAIVAKVHDGDTVSVIFGGRKEKVRLIGIDAPELDQRPWGMRAKKHLAELLDISERRVILEFDVEKRDKYGRLLCYIWTPDKKMLNLRMIKDGYAMLFTIPPNVRYVAALMKAQQEARQQRLGIWGSNGLKESPYDYRKAHPRLY